MEATDEQQISKALLFRDLTVILGSLPFAHTRNGNFSHPTTPPTQRNVFPTEPLR
jgi:hypothetical protein